MVLITPRIDEGKGRLWLTLPPKDGEEGGKEETFWVPLDGPSEEDEVERQLGGGSQEGWESYVFSSFPCTLHSLEGLTNR